jgi:HJR/Mrr/RecB family endonuclease
MSSKKNAIKEATRRAIIAEFRWTDDIDPLEFETRCAEAMQLSGWTAHTTKKTGDQGVDVLADKRGMKVVLQYKLYTNTVGNKAVQEVFAAKTFTASDFAAVVSTSPYSRGAKELAQKTGVLLFTLLRTTPSEFAVQISSGWRSPVTIPGRGNSIRCRPSTTLRYIWRDRLFASVAHLFGSRRNPH